VAAVVVFVAVAPNVRPVDAPEAAGRPKPVLAVEAGAARPNPELAGALVDVAVAPPRLKPSLTQGIQLIEWYTSCLTE